MSSERGVGARAPRVLYLAYWGAAEPLGQSLVLPAVVQLKERGVDLTLVTFDKPRDLDDPTSLRAVGDLLGARGIRWVSLRYHHRPRLPATAFDILQGWAFGVRAALRSPVDVVHARTYVGGVIGRLIAPTLHARLIYHNEGFYPDEQVDGGFWAHGSWMHRLTRAIEADLYARADGLIALSHRARAELEALPAVRRRGTPVITVPSCVDLERFPWIPERPNLPADPLRFVYTGAVGGRYELNRIGRFLAVAAQDGANVRLRVLTRAEPSLVAEMLARGGLSREAWSLDCLPHSAMPVELRGHHVGLFFLARGRSERGCSPTKIAEYWACGLPVVTSPNVSDTDEIIARKHVGVVVGDHSDEAYRSALQELRSLLEDPDLSRRCREAAEEHYALGPAVECQLELYRSLLARGSAAEADARVRGPRSDEKS